MKTFLLITLILILFTGCSSSNAFSRFNLTSMQIKCENSILSSKIHSQNKTIGTLSVLYLNQVLAKTYNKDEWFYVSIYTTKDKGRDIKFFLNGEEALSVKELQVKNKFSYLLSSTQEWKRYYLVRFKKLDNRLSFIAKNSNFTSDPLIYKKED